MSSATRNSSYKLKGLVTLLYRYRISSSSPSPLLFQEYFSSKLGYGGNYMINHQGLRTFINGGTGSRSEADNRKPMFNMEKDVQPPSPKTTGLSTWVKWLLGFALSMLLPLNQKWESFRQLEGKVEMIAEQVEEVAEVVEKVATVAEKISSEVADQLPDNSMIKGAVLAVERISEETAADAQLTQNFIHKVEDVKQDLKDLETIVEPVIHK